MSHHLLASWSFIEACLGFLLSKHLGDTYVKQDANKKQTSGGKGADCEVSLVDVSASVCGDPQ